MSLLPRESEETIRAFIAIPVPEGVVDEIIRFRDSLKKELPEAKWTRPEGFHVTLKFLGEISLSMVEDVKRAMDESSGEWKDFEISLGGAGVFPAPAKARVFWVGSSAGEGGCIRIFRSLEKPLEAIGFSREKRSFRVHITLARFRQPGPVTNMVLNSPFSSSSFPAKKVVLYQSTLNPSGAVYTPLYTIKLPD